MHDTPTAAAAPRLSWLLVGLFLAWMLPGLFGHEPWKPDEGYTIGLVNHIVQTGDWVVPTLAGEPFMEKPPVFFITAALFAKLLSPWLMPLHQAAGLATVLYIGLTVLFSYLAARESGGRRMGAAAALGLLGCLGFLVRAHTVITDTSLWCGFAMACYGMVLSDRRRLAGAFWFGSGAGLAFMAKGFMGPVFLGLGVLALPLFCPDRRGWKYFGMLAWAFLFSLPWLTLWPAALYLRSPELFSDWFWLNNVGRFLGPRFGFPALAQVRGRWGYLLRFPWFMLPLWPAAFFAWWSRGRSAFRDASLVYPTAVVAGGMALLIMAAGQRELYMIPLIPPLAVLAARGWDSVPSWLDWPLRRLPLVLFGLLLAAVWTLWGALALGVPRALPDRLEAHFSDPALGAGTPAVAAALLFTGGWLWLFACRPGIRAQWTWVWALGVTAVWGTAMLLFLPALDHGNGYRGTFAAMVSRLPADETVAMDAYRLGESQRAILEYYFGRRTRAVGEAGRPAPSAPYLLAQNHRRHARYDPGPGWRVLWEGTRPGDGKEWYVLYRREPEEPSPGAPRAF